MDFFAVEAVTWAGLVRFHVLFVIDLATRRVEIAGIVHQPHDAWMQQVGRNLTDAVDGFLLKYRCLIMDRDPLFTRGFRELLAASGVKSVRLPARSPNLNAYAERWVGSVRRECLARVMPLGERHHHGASSREDERAGPAAINGSRRRRVSTGAPSCGALCRRRLCP
jgi:transposase InsO family protein